jgi:hypothetical protein
MSAVATVHHEDDAEAGSSSDRTSNLGLRSFMIRPFSLDEFTTAPVVVVHGRNISTLIMSLLVQTQERFGLDGAIIINDRCTQTYGQGVINLAAVVNEPLEKVLTTLIDVQVHRQNTLPDKPLLRLAVAVDDCIYNAKTLKSETLQSRIRLAYQYNIMIIIGTSDLGVLPPNVHTFATHVLATRCVSTEEPKQLQKKLFVMFETHVALADVLANCRPYEFLVGVLRSDGTSGTTVQDFSRTYTPTLYVRDDKAATAAARESFWDYSGAGADALAAASVKAEFKIDPELLAHLTHAMGVSSRKNI